MGKIFIILFLLLSIDCHSQTDIIYKGTYTDSFIYKSNLNDTYAFEMYPDGDFKLFEDEKTISVTNFIDKSRNILDYTLYIDKFVRANEYDSFKTIYYWNGSINYKSISLQKIAFRNSGGCFLYQNKGTMYWYQYESSYYHYDKNKNCVKQISYFDFHVKRDTQRIRNIYRYNKNGQILEMKHFISDTLNEIYRYAYDSDYRKTEVFNNNAELINLREEFFKDKKLIRELIFNNWTEYIKEILYTYNEKGLLKIIESYNLISNKKRDLFQIRTFKYNHL